MRERLFDLIAEAIPSDTPIDCLPDVDAIADHLLAAGVVEVVRCKDCIYYQSSSCFNRQWDLESSTEIPMVRDCDYCSYGERREK